LILENAIRLHDGDLPEHQKKPVREIEQPNYKFHQAEQD